MQDFGAKNKICLHNFCFCGRRLLFAGHCKCNFEVGQQSCVGVLEITNI